MTDQRPQYGELATPEEQRRAAGLPALDHVDAKADGVAGPQAASAAHPAVGAANPRREASSMDRIATFALLGFGLINVLSSIAGLLDLASTMNRTMEILGIEGEFTAFALARTWGTIATVVLLAGYAVTVWLSLRRVKARRHAWWAPLAGFVVTTLAVSICISVPMFADPAFMQSVSAPVG
ncbi:DUF6264 family protein [Microbacterium sp.]|uniref:DUF6264 family protein n=1 Tax=Microbacterium sp. TaxID=51671 RepID=UPI0028113EC1|nr:DUF6264 family protein [Microbacterium sp.]